MIKGIVGLISTPNAPFVGENIATPSNLNLEVDVAW